MKLNWFQRFWGGAVQQSFPYFGPEMRHYTATANNDPSGLAAVRRCVAVLVDGVASTSVSLLRQLPGGGKTVVADHPAAKALRLLQYADLELFLTDALFGGNGFLVIDRSASPLRLVVAPSHTVTVAVDQSGSVWYEIAEDTTRNKPRQTVPARDMVHLRYRVDPANPLIGLSPLAASKSSWAALVESYILHERLAKNQSSPGMILSTDQNLTREQIDKLRERWQTQSAGLAAGGTVILSSGLRPTDPAQNISQKDADLVEALRFSVEEASRIYGVPVSMLGHTKDTSYATAAEERRAFLSATLRPLMVRVADALGVSLLTDQERLEGLGIEFDASDFGAGKELAETISNLLNSGVLTLNECRNRLGLPDVTGGDVPRVPANVMPEGSWQTYFDNTNRESNK